MGRLKKPDNLKKLHGTDRPDRMNYDQPPAEIILEAPAPDHFDKLETKIWGVVTGELIKTNMLFSYDLQTITIMCQELAAYYGLYSLTKGKLAKIKNGKIEYSKEAYNMKMIQNMHLKTALSLMKQFGMTPVARQQIQLHLASMGGVSPKEGAKKAALPPKPKDIDI